MADRVIVVGGGVIGGFCAWELAKAGVPVTLLEQNRFGAGCSYGNCGYVSPSHLLPLAQPGTILKTLKAMLKPNSPFSIRPSWSLQSISWFWNFMWSCNSRQMLSAAQGLHSLLMSSKNRYQELVKSHELACQWKEMGILFVFEHQSEFESFSVTEKLIRENFGVGAEAYSTSRLVEFEPSIKPIVAGAWHYKGDCHLNPGMLMRSLKSQLERTGVEIVESITVNDFVIVKDRVQSVQTNHGLWSADQIVFATGAWSAQLQKKLGFSIPIQPGKGYSITLPCPANMPTTPIIFEDTHVAITPFEDRFRIGSTMEFAGFDQSIRAKRLQLLRDSARRYLDIDWHESQEEHWFGWRPMTWDSKPLIGRVPKLENVWLCAGHGMLGISMAPASGQLLRELMLRQSPHLPPEPFSLQRL